MLPKEHVPQRLTEHAAQEIRRYYSPWTAATQAFAASGYADPYYQQHVSEKPT
jgi:hypothetical protein